LEIEDGEDADELSQEDSQELEGGGGINVRCVPTNSGGMIQIACGI